MVERFNPNYSAYTAQCMHKADRGSWVRAADYDALTEERDRLKQWQADQVEAIDEAKALITELNIDKKALEAERDRLALANAELLAGLDALVNAKAIAGVRNIVAGWNGENRPDGPYKERHPSRLGATLPKTDCGSIYELDEAMQFARALLDKHKATSTEREGE